MRRVNIRHGLKQRINEILGTDYIGGGQVTPPGITDWSIQSAIIENLKRVVSGIAGDVRGTPMNGLELGGVGGTTFTLSKGYGFTNNGNIIVVEIDLSNLTLATGDGDNYIYVKHSLAYLEDDGSTPGAKKTGFIGKSGEENIVIDDLGATLGSNITEGDDVIVVSTSLLSGSSLDNHVFLGTIVASSGTITSITPHSFTLNNLSVKEDLAVDGTITSGNTSTNAINVAKANISDTLTVEDLILNGTLTVGNGSVLDIDSLASVKSGGDNAYTGTIDASSTPNIVVKNGFVISVS